MIDVHLLQCPHDGLPLQKEDEELTADCGHRFRIQDDAPIFVEQEQQEGVDAHRKPRSFLRRIAHLLQPPHHSLYFGSIRNSLGEGKELQRLLRSHPGETILNIGSLSMDLKHLHPRIINLDICHYPHIDVVGDVHALPFKDECIDIILFKNVIEHIRNPAKGMAEIWRVLKPGGVLYIKLPFLQPFHAVPDDYQRHSWEGMRELLQGYEEMERGIAVGPGSMISWMLREWLAILTSFGSQKLYNCGIIFWGWLTFWMRYTDVFFARNPLSHRISSAYYGIYQKPLSPMEQ